METFWRWSWAKTAGAMSSAAAAMNRRMCSLRCAVRRRDRDCVREACAPHPAPAAPPSPRRAGRGLCGSLRDDQFDAAVLLPPGRGFVRGDRLGLAFADGGDAVGRHAGADEGVAHGLGALL